MYIPQHQCEDKLLWHYTTDGVYSVKSRYWLSNHLLDNLISILIPPPTGSPHLKNKIWKTSIPPKLKNFLWRILSLTRTGTELNRRGIPIDAVCKRCHHNDESINHMLFKCPYASTVWNNSHHPVSSLLYPENSLEENISQILVAISNASNKDQKHMPFWILWHIWKSRNDLIFNKISWEPNSVIRKAKDDVLEWNSVRSNHHRIQETQSIPRPSCRWIAPPPRCLK